MSKLKTLFPLPGNNDSILKITCLFWLFTKLMGWRIWTTQRLLPTVPVFGFLDRVPPVLHSVLFLVSVFILLVLFFRSNKYLIAALLVTEIFLCLLDLNRLVPWEYLYAFIVFVFVININTPDFTVPGVILILASTYFYSGLCKLNEGFLHIVWTNMVLHAFVKLPQDIIAKSWVYYGGYIAGVIELLAGLGLLFAKTRKKSSVVLIFLHLFILLLLGPFGLRGYRVLWPWNISMILLLLVLFVYNGKNVVISPFRIPTKGWNKLVLLCWVILPVLSFFGYWDRNLSSNLFSANLPRMIICIGDTSKCPQLKRFISKKDITGTCKGQAKVDLQTWAVVETGVSAYPEIRTYHIIQKKLEQEYTAAGLSFVYLNR